MKKHILISMALLAASSMAVAAGKKIDSVSANAENVVCDGTATGGKAPVWGGSGASIPVGTEPVFTRAGFDIQCSANVFMSFTEVNANLATIASASAKGNQFFGGSSNGGAISNLGKCADPTVCKTGDITKGLQEALKKATSTGS